MSLFLGGVVAIAAQDFLASLVAKVVVNAGEKLVRKGDAVTIPVAVLQDILAAQARTIEQNQLLQGQLQRTLEQLSADRVVYVVEAPILSIRMSSSFVDTATLSFSPKPKGSPREIEPIIAEQETNLEEVAQEADASRTTSSSPSPPEATFQERMRRAYPDRDLEFD